MLVSLLALAGSLAIDLMPPLALPESVEQAAFHLFKAHKTGVASLSNYGAWPSTGITHGDQLTVAMTGPTALGVSLNQLFSWDPTGYRYNNYPSDSHPWDSGGPVPSGNYVLNNDPTNHGGIVPTGGMTIDGFFIPAGVRVVQFIAFTDQSYINGDGNGAAPAFPGVVFRGCSFRGAANEVPGYLNLQANSHTNLWFLYNTAGGTGTTLADTNAVAMKVNDTSSNSVYFRNYISNTATGIQPDTDSSAVIENYIDHVELWSESFAFHLNGVSYAGGESNALLLRNHITLADPDDLGNSIAQTDAIALFHDFAGYPGTGTNLDGTTGYQIRDNYMGGGGYPLYAGTGGSLGSTVSSNNFTVTGNKFTTQWHTQSGAAGTIDWPTTNFTNFTCSNNTYADGSNAGASVGCF